MGNSALLLSQFLRSETKKLALTGKFHFCICFLVLLLHREITRYVERAEETPGLSSKTLLCQILCSWLWCVPSRCSALLWEPQPHLGLGSAQTPSLTLTHLLPGPGVSATAANRSTEQLHRQLLLDATGLEKGSEIEGSKAEFPDAQLGHPRELRDTCSAPSMPKGADVLFQRYFRIMEKIPMASWFSSLF